MASARPTRMAAVAASSKFAELSDDETSDSEAPMAKKEPSAKKRLRKTGDSDEEEFVVDKKARNEEAAEEEEEEAADEGVGQDEDDRDYGSSSAAASSKSEKKPRRVGIGKKIALKKRLMALTQDQLADLVVEFISPGGAGAEMHDVFMESIGGVDVEALAELLKKASRQISKAQPRYANGDMYAYKRCKSAIDAFVRLVAAQAATLGSGGAPDDLIAWIPLAVDVVSRADFHHTFERDLHVKISSAVAKVQKGKGVTQAQVKALEATSSSSVGIFGW